MVAGFGSSLVSVAAGAVSTGAASAGAAAGVTGSVFGGSEAAATRCKYG